MHRSASPDIFDVRDGGDFVSQLRVGIVLVMITLAGIGSPHGADRVGWAVIDHLKPHLEPRMRCVKCDPSGNHRLSDGL
ncbi:MAG: hypothetical protein KDA60_04205 [Planctomycetales bacterium]|nr:hypothetical protein [Planctomycetales bacterium]